MIQVEQLTKYYGSLPAIQDVSFTVRQGEILGFLGPNAAGKTTTMRILSGYLTPTEGTARVAGYDVVKDSLEVRRRIGYLPETVPLYPEMTVRGYLEYMAALRGVRERSEAADRVMAACGLAGCEEMLIGKLSKGYRQRVGLAQALIHDPQVLILDEPTIGLDPRQIIEIRNLIKSLGGSRTVILSTHILPEVSQVCERVMIISKGRLVAEDTPAGLGAALRGAQRLFVHMANPAPETVPTLQAIPGVLEVHENGDGYYEIESALDADARPRIAEAVVQRGWGLLELRPSGMSLEEIFLTLTTEDIPGHGEDQPPELAATPSPVPSRR
jgi:ABC-2 type transport system ATP-binding protein